MSILSGKSALTLPPSSPAARAAAATEAAIRLPVSVLTGFLGSGKTTLLARLVRHPGMARVACVINELGDVGLDHLLVARSTEETVVLDSGCICCTLRNDLVETLSTLFVRRVRGEIPEFDRVVIETTGLADPAPVLHTLMSNPLIAARYRLDGVVTTVDALHGAGQLEDHPESVKQAAVADRLVITKGDLAAPESTARLITRLRQLNPAAPILTASHGHVAPEALFDAGLYNPATKSPDVGRWLNDGAYASQHEHGPGHDHDSGTCGCEPHGHDRRIASFCLVVDQPMPWDRFLDFTDALIALYGDRVLRLKCLLNIEDSVVPLVVHGVQHMFHPVVPLSHWPYQDRRSKLVLITRDLAQGTVAALLESHLQAGAEQSKL